MIMNDKCNYCNQVDIIEHHLYYCHVSRLFWENTSLWLQKLTNIQITFVICEVVFGLVNAYYEDDRTAYIANCLIILGKWYLNSKNIYMESIVFSQFVELINKINSLKMCYSMNGNLDDFKNKFEVLDL